MLVAYIIVGIGTELAWMTYAPILPFVARIYKIPRDYVGLLSAIPPIIYIAISLPAGYFIDSKGFRKAVVLGSAFLASFGFLRYYADSFATLVIFQTLASISTPFVDNSISKISKTWFPKEEEGLATGLGFISIFIGFLLAFVLTPYLVDLYGYKEMLFIYGAYFIFAMLVFIALGKEPEWARSIGKAIEKKLVKPSGIVSVLRCRNMLFLSLIFFIVFGVYIALETWIGPIFLSRGFSIRQADALISIMVIGGIIGSVLISFLSDFYKTSKKLIVAGLMASVFLWYFASKASGFIVNAALMFAIGFTFISVLPPSLDLSTKTLRIYEGTANSILWEFSQVGAFFFIFLLSWFYHYYGYGYVLPLLVVLSIIALALSANLRE
ncbi:MAG: MFS transporter [Caldisphaeraceae archaeon]|nr:MFS transporter [Caldisphaeraceae archaeon]